MKFSKIAKCVILAFLVSGNMITIFDFNCGTLDIKRTNFNSRLANSHFGCFINTKTPGRHCFMLMGKHKRLFITAQHGWIVTSIIINKAKGFLTIAQIT